MSAAPNAKDGIPFGRYTLRERLGKGGMGEVWKADMTGPGGYARTMVIKRVLPELVEEIGAVESFIAEARLSARLHHSNIVQVFEFGDFEGEAFLAMEYVDGWTLSAVLNHSLTPPPVGFSAFIAQETCRALAYAHAFADENGESLRIVHRDVSPSNVMISADGSVKLLDFGIAKVLTKEGNAKTKTGVVRGKLGYMAPEQAAGAPIDHRADLFSVGIFLHEALTRRRLFDGENDLQTVALVRESPIAAPSELNPEVTPALDRVCQRALRRDLAARYQSAKEMAADLQEELHRLRWGQERCATYVRELMAVHGRHVAPVSDPPVGVLAPTPALPDAGKERRRSSRAKRVALWAAVVAVALLGGGGYRWMRATHEQPPAVAPPPKPTARVAVPDAPPPVVAPPVPAVAVHSETVPRPKRDRGKKRGAKSVDYENVVDPFSR